MNTGKVSIVTFKGGIHPAGDGKYLAKDSAIRVAPLLEKYYVAVQQNIGAPPKVVVSVGEEVKKRQLIAEPGGFVSVSLHSPTSGKVAAIELVAGPMGVPVQSIVIEADGKDEEAEPLPSIVWQSAEAAELKKRIAAAGIVGMGGAAFPTAVKLSPPPDKKIDVLILNGAECEPYLTADHRLMLEEPDKVLAGAAIMGRALGVTDINIGVELNKTDAIDALLAKAKLYGVKIFGLKVRYPQGAEKQLIYAISGRKVPAGGLPMDAGCVVQNVGTAAAVADAVIDGKVLIDRVTTVTGEAVNRPANLRLRIGTPISKAIEFAGGLRTAAAKMIFGGPMMGFAQKSLEVAVQKNTSGILLLPPEKVVQYESSSCIRCGRCVAACPMNLQPSILGTAIESEKFDLAYQNHLMDCIECGSCAYVCPAHRPLVQHMRRGKAEIRRKMAAEKAAKAAKEAADKAKADAAAAKAEEKK